MSKLSAPATPKLDDTQTELVRRELERKIVELQQVPAVGLQLISGVSLADTVLKHVPHKLGRKPVWVGISVVRGAVSTGRIVESFRDDTIIDLTANGHGATITVDLLVM